MRKIPALFVTATVLAGLTACTGSAAGQGCDTSVGPGDASSVITATGRFGSAPTVDFPTPVVTQSLERSELLPGDGELLHEGETAVLKVTVLNGADGRVLQQSDYSADGGSLITVGNSAFPAVSLGIECAAVGSRVAVVGSAQDTHMGQADPANGIAAGDSFIYVLDIMDSYPAKADGAPQLPKAGLPAVVLAPNGAPGITVPKQDPPSELTTAVLQAADGEELEKNDGVLLKYTGVVWADSKVFDTTWTAGQASILQLTESDKMPAGLVEALEGQKVGSQVLVVVPPDEGFGDRGRPGVAPGATLVYVVDILGITR